MLIILMLKSFTKEYHAILGKLGNIVKKYLFHYKK